PLYLEGGRLLGNSYANLDNCYGNMGRPALREKTLAEAIAIQRQLVKENPRNPLFKQDLYRSLVNLGEMHQEAGRYRAADIICDEGVPELLQLVKENPFLYRLQNVQCEMYVLGGNVRHARGQSTAAARYFQLGLEVYEKITKQNPKEKDMLIYRAAA